MDIEVLHGVLLQNQYVKLRKFGIVNGFNITDTVFLKIQPAHCLTYLANGFWQGKQATFRETNTLHTGAALEIIPGDYPDVGRYEAHFFNGCSNMD